MFSVHEVDFTQKETLQETRPSLQPQCLAQCPRHSANAGMEERRGPRGGEGGQGAWREEERWVEKQIWRLVVLLP